MNTIETVLKNIFKCYSGYFRSSGNIADDLESLPKYLEIPIGNSNFEIPVFVFGRFIKEAYKCYNRELAANTIAVNLYSHNFLSSYKSVDAILKNILDSTFNIDKLHPIKLDTTDHVYYGTQGALFDKDLNPIMLCMWRISRYFENETVKFGLERPIVRIDSQTFTAKDDQINRWISGKFVNKVLNLRISSGVRSAYPYTDAFNLVRYGEIIPKINNVSLIVEPIPFKLKCVKKPSIATNNEDLIKVVSDNFQEIIDWSQLVI